MSESGGEQMPDVNRMRAYLSDYPDCAALVLGVGLAEGQNIQEILPRVKSKARSLDKSNGDKMWPANCLRCAGLALSITDAKGTLKDVKIGDSMPRWCEVGSAPNIPQ